MIRPGSPIPLGATADADGTNFAVYSSVAERIELCLFNTDGRTTRWHELPACIDGVWHGYLPGCKPGQRYGYRVEGPWDPDLGLRCNRAKLLLDPYARQIVGAFTWNNAVFDYVQHEDGSKTINTIDSAAFVPKCIVTEAAAPLPLGPRIPWSDTIFYEANVRGYTMQHPAINDAVRGRFEGMRQREILDYLRSLGITSLELMPVHAFIDEHHLAKRGLQNFWGYNTVAYFAPEPRYADCDPLAEFRDMVRAIHDAGIEVILDVVYNHTGESDGYGPTLCFRGLDNLCYYSTEPGHPNSYINDTGCGNTLNVDHPQVRKLVLDSLHYWHDVMGVDGFRFDLAPVLGRHNHGYSSTHPMLDEIGADPNLADTKLIAEPWDPGPGGYQLGEFPKPWAEWNDRYRDTVRRFWRGDEDTGSEFAERLRGSADLFEKSDRKPTASVNFICSHDGFTLADLVSYEHRHNEANGEDNRDGHAHNYSCNYGVEGSTDDPGIIGLRRQHRLNMLATLFVSQGSPLLLSGDEFGNSQHGNNNAYAQDNEIGWIDWSGLESDAEFADLVRQLVRLRKSTALLTLPDYVHGRLKTDDHVVDIAWLNADGDSIKDDEWSRLRRKNILVTGVDTEGVSEGLSILINGLDETARFVVPAVENGSGWRVEFASAAAAACRDNEARIPGHSMAILRYA